MFCLKAGQHAHHRGLAAAGWADHGNEIAVIDVVSDILHDVEFTLGCIEDHRDVVELRPSTAYGRRAHAAALSCHTSSLALIRRRIVSMINAIQPMQMMPT
jgi:hypothetical protein